ncbi:hypothetical protein ACLOJK_025518 [Asimina triloba]
MSLSHATSMILNRAGKRESGEAERGKGSGGRRDVDSSSTMKDREIGLGKVESEKWSGGDGRDVDSSLVRQGKEMGVGTRERRKRKRAHQAKGMRDYGRKGRWLKRIRLTSEEDEGRKAAKKRSDRRGDEDKRVRT